MNIIFKYLKSFVKCPKGRKFYLKNDNSKIHCHDELCNDLWGNEWISEETLAKWYWDLYSTSKHFYCLQSWVVGLKSKTIVEVGFGRSTFVLMRAAHLVGGQFISVDKRDFSHLCSDSERNATQFINGFSDQLWTHLMDTNQKVDFIFLDYFSDENCKADFCEAEITKAFQFLNPGGVIAVHDTIEKKYPISGSIYSIAEKLGLECSTSPYNYGMSYLRMKEDVSTDHWLKKND